jgi:Ca2+-transporting ATPase
MVLYSSDLGIPALGESFGMVPLSIDDWALVISWAAPILLVDEILKAIGRWVNREDRKKSRRLNALEN